MILPNYECIYLCMHMYLNMYMMNLTASVVGFMHVRAGWVQLRLLGVLV